MATPDTFDKSNGTLVGPEGSGIAPLPVFRNGTEVISCWRLSVEELQEILKTGCVWLRVLGQSQPPCLVQGQTPFAPVEAPRPVVEGSGAAGGQGGLVVPEPRQRREPLRLVKDETHGQEPKA